MSRLQCFSELLARNYCCVIFPLKLKTYKNEYDESLQDWRQEAVEGAVTKQAQSCTISVAASLSG